MVHWLPLDLTTKGYVLVDAPPTPRCVILGFHGYGERPAHCLEGLRRARVDGALLVGPMGQHHFYNRESKVVASWMTKFHREDQVQQILQFGRTVWEAIEAEHASLPLYLFGFSQGASTAYRVAALGGVPVRRLFALAGDIPPELVDSLDSIPPFPVSILHGDADAVVPEEVLDADLRRLEAAGWPVELHRFAGDHGYAAPAMEWMGERIRGELGPNAV